MNEQEDFEFRLRMEREAQDSAIPAAEPVKASLTDKIVGSAPVRLAMGAVAAPVKAIQLGANIGDMLSPYVPGYQEGQPKVGEWVNKKLSDIEASKQRGMQSFGNEGYDWIGLGGSFLSAGPITKGVSSAASSIAPALTNLAGKEGAKALMARMLLGSVQGGVAGGLQPITDASSNSDVIEKTGLQTMLSGALGGVLPAVTAGIGKIGSTVKQAAQPFYEKGRAAILKQFQEAMMQNDPALKAQYVQAASQAKPGMGGVMPTLGETLAGLPDEQLAARSTGLAAHQKDIAKIGGVSPDFAAQQAAQEAAHRAGIGTVAKTPSALEQALQTRAAAAKQNYGTAFQQPVHPDASFAALADRPSMQKAVARAADLAKEEGATFDPTSVQSMHYVKKALDDMLSTTSKPGGLGPTEAGATAKTQQEFLTWLEQQSPAYGTARTTHRALSEPVNRMQVGQELEKALTGPLGTNERSAVFAKAMQDAPRTIKRATGQQMFENLDEVLKPNEMGTVKQIAEEMAKRDTFNKLAGKTSIGGKDAIPGDIGLPLPNLLWRPSMIANFMMKHFAKGAEDKIAKVAGQQYLDPRLFADAMKDVPPRYQPMLEALMQQAPAAAGTTTGRQF